MRRRHTQFRPPRRIAAVSATLALTAAAVLTPLGFTATAQAGQQATAASAVSRPVAPVAVTLPTGQKVLVSNDGRHVTASVEPAAHGAATPVVTAAFGGATYVIPVSALRQIGGTYALAQFDVSALAGFSKAPAAVHPDYQQYTFTLKGINVHGHEAGANSAYAFVVNVDDETAYDGGQSFYRGVAKFSLPVGNYFAIGFFFSGSAQRSVLSVPTISQFAVTGQGQTGTLDARNATVQPALVTPKAATVADEELTITRTDPAGHISGFGIGDFAKTLIQPTTSPVSVGEYVSDDYFRAVGPDYLYDVDEFSPASEPVPADQTYSPGQSSFATVAASYASDGGTRTVLECRSSFGPFSFVVVRALLPITAPARRTEYVLGDPNITWSQSVVADPDDFVGGYTDGYHVYTAGEDATVSWLGQPSTATPYPGNFCSACRQGNTLTVSWADFGDAAGHAGYDDRHVPGLHESREFTVSRNGKTLADEPYMFAQTKLPGSAGTYVLQLSTERVGDGFKLSTATNTVWTVQSAASTGSDVPAGEVCADGTRTDCSVFSLLRPVWDLPVDLTGTAPAGPTTLGLTLVDPLGRTVSKVKDLAVSVSYDGGTSWVPTTVQRAGATSTVSYVAPGKSGFVSLKVVAGTASASVTQTITKAYRLGAPAPSSAPAVSTAHNGTATAAGCATAAHAGWAHCDALIAKPGAGGLTANAAGVGPAGFHPADLQAAYHLPTTGGAGRTVGIVDAYGDPNAAKDLAVYRKTFGLRACTTASGCLRIVDERGGSTLPAPDGGWAEETSLDLDMVSASCPDCKILLVQADDPTFANLGAAVDTAVRLGAVSVSNSYSTNEWGGMHKYSAYYDHPGVAVTASSGDYGFGPAQFPATLTTTIAVGGTALVQKRSGAYAETAWSGAGSGCSAYVHKPAWQTDTHCPGRTVSDISAVADPDTGVAVRDSYDTGYSTDWLVFGGTSVSSPLIAGMYGLAGTTAGVTGAGGIYAHSSSLYDVVGGSNGGCGGDYLCTAVPGYDGPTGLGSPRGLGAFAQGN